MLEGVSESVEAVGFVVHIYFIHYYRPGLSEWAVTQAS